MSAESYISKASEPTSKMNRSSLEISSEPCRTFADLFLARKSRRNSVSACAMSKKDLSPWSRSNSKRAFDCTCVLLMMPVILPLFLAVGLVVRLTSSGPVLFFQRRMGRNGRDFTIMKFRTMIHCSDKAHQPVTTSGNQCFTSVGPFLRRWKLDELPQLFNVLTGHMSLVGPRPKMPEHAISNLPCRAGITGAATIAFAREEAILDRVPQHHLKSFYHSVVLPAKHQLDADYMANATFLSDLKIIFDSVLRRWDSSIIESLLEEWTFEQRNRIPLPTRIDSGQPFVHAPKIPHMDRTPAAGEVRAY